MVEIIFLFCGRRRSLEEVYSSIPFSSKFLIFSEPPDMVPVSFGRDLFDEGTFAQAVCTITAGDQPLKISWSFHGHSISSDQGITTTNIGTRTSILMIQSVGHKHRGNYTCLASNKAGNISHTAELRVNGRSFLMEAKRGHVKEKRQIQAFSCQKLSGELIQELVFKIMSFIAMDGNCLS